MRTFPDLRMRALVEGAHRAQQQLDPDPRAEARDLFAATQAVPLALPATPGPAS